jgi:hypothetical protein
MRRLKIDRYVLIIIAFSIFAWLPLWGPPYFLKAHDAPHSVMYLVEFDQALRDGAWYPRWSPDFDYGYGWPLFVVYSPLAFYVAEAFHLLGLSFTDSARAVFGLAFIVSGLTMYGFVRRLYGARAGLLAGLFYVYVPFHLSEIYVRSVFAEFCALALAPLAFWAFSELVAEPNRRRLALAAVSYAALFLTHHGTAFLITPLLAAYVLFLLWSVRRTSEVTSFSPPRRKGRQEKIESLCGLGVFAVNFIPRTSGILWRAALALCAALLAAMLSAICLLPALLESRYVVLAVWTTGSYNYAAHFVYLSQYLSPFWGYGYSGEGLADGMSFQLGAVALTLSLAAIVCALYRRQAQRGATLFFALVILTTLPLMTGLSTPLWEILPLAKLVQFPWRMLALPALAMSVLAGALVACDEEEGAKSGDGLLYALILVVILGSFPYTLPEYTAPDPRMETPTAVWDWIAFSPADRLGKTVWVKEPPPPSPLGEDYLAFRPLNKAHVLRGAGTAQTLHHGGHSDVILVQAQEEITLQIYTYYFPGWRATVDGQEVPIRPEGPYGLITLEVPPGEHRVEVRFGDTPLRTAGAWLSAAALLLTLALLLIRREWLGSHTPPAR